MHPSKKSTKFVNNFLNC